MNSKSEAGFNIAPSLGLYRLKQSLNDIGVKCDILDMDIDDRAPFIKKCRDGFYRVIGMSVSHANMKSDLAILNEFSTAAKSFGKEVLIIAGGQDASFNYRNWLKSGIDYIFTGYAENNLQQFASILLFETTNHREAIKKLPGLAFKQGEEYIFNPCHEISSEEFDKLFYEQVMHIDIPYKKYWEITKENAPSLNVWTSIFIPENVRLYTSTHCPFNCGFCSSHNFPEFCYGIKSGIKSLDAARVTNLVKHYTKKYEAKSFLFSDDEFLINKKRALEFCNRIIEAKKNGEISPSLLFNCQARVSDFILGENEKRYSDKEFISLLSKTGFHSIGIGVETFSERLLGSPSINKAGFTKKDIITATESLLEYSIIPQVNIILFIPETTPDELIDTIIEANKSIIKGCQIVVAPHLYALPGSNIANSADYEATKETFISPISGETITIKNHIIPKHPNIREVSEQFDESLEEEKESFLRSGLWSSNVIPKTLLGLISFITTARLFKRIDVVNELFNTIKYIIRRNHI